jgi:hypothetical protein
MIGWTSPMNRLPKENSFQAETTPPTRPTLDRSANSRDSRTRQADRNRDEDSLLPEGRNHPYRQRAARCPNVSQAVPDRRLGARQTPIEADT